MTNTEIAARSANALASLSQLKAGLANIAAAIPPAGGEPILRMGKDGIWVYGANNAEVLTGSEWAANPLSLRHGYICWKERAEGSREPAELLGERYVSMFDPAIAEASLPRHGDNRWVKEFLIDLKCLNGDDEGVQVVYKPSSIGGSTAMSELITKMMARLDSHPDTPVPVLKLEFDTYPHKTWGKTYVPVLTIVDWIDMNGVAAAPAAAAPEPAPAAASGRRQPAAATAPETAPAAASGRRRPAAPEAVAAAPAPAEEAAPAEASPAGGERRRRRV